MRPRKLLCLAEDEQEHLGQKRDAHVIRGKYRSPFIFSSPSSHTHTCTEVINGRCPQSLGRRWCLKVTR